MRKRRGFFERYAHDEPLDLIGMINCAGCPTLAVPEKILKRIRALAEYRLDALHLSYCITALCPFVKKYSQVIEVAYPELEVILGTHRPIDNAEFRRGVKELLCPVISQPQDMNDMALGRLRVPGEELRI
jgi:predicted metal-binding protein